MELRKKNSTIRRIRNTLVFFLCRVSIDGRRKRWLEHPPHHTGLRTPIRNCSGLDSSNEGLDSKTLLPSFPSLCLAQWNLFFAHINFTMWPWARDCINAKKKREETSNKNKHVHDYSHTYFLPGKVYRLDYKSTFLFACTYPLRSLFFYCCILCHFRCLFVWFRSFMVLSVL